MLSGLCIKKQKQFKKNPSFQLCNFQLFNLFNFKFFYCVYFYLSFDNIYSWERQSDNKNRLSLLVTICV